MQTLKERAQYLIARANCNADSVPELLRNGMCFRVREHAVC